MATRLTDLGDELLAHVLVFSAPRDVEALTVASRLVAREVVPRFPSIWKAIFRRRWEALNFPLDGVAQGTTTLEINEHLHALFPSSCPESRQYQLLAHAITPVPSYANIQRTRQATGYTDASHRIISLHPPDLGESHPVDFALDGGILGKDRCVRANVPFPTTFHVAVFKRHSSHHSRTTQSQPGYEIGVVPGAYFELSISKRAHRHAGVRRNFGLDSMTSIGLANSTFPLVGSQPGWTHNSYGYHGDDGRYYHADSFEGSPFGSSFSAGHTVGCGIRVNPETNVTFTFFTREGELVDGENGVYVECEHREWYPVVGMDSYDALHLNFGQEPFKYDDIADELFEECEGMATVVSQQLQWNDIRDSDGESSSEGEQDQHEDESVDNDFDFDSDSDMSEEGISAALIMDILAERRAGMGDSG